MEAFETRKATTAPTAKSIPTTTSPETRYRSPAIEDTADYAYEDTIRETNRDVRIIARKRQKEKTACGTATWRKT